MAAAENPNISKPSAGNGTKPSGAVELAGGFGAAGVWGIDNVLSNCIIQSESITSEDITDDTQDQKGAMVSRLTYDRHWTLNLTFLTDQADLNSGEVTAVTAPGDTAFTYGGAKWFVNSVTYNGSYNQKKSYTLNAERWQNYPSQS